MNIDQILVAIDEEMARLTQVKSLLAGSTTTTTTAMPVKLTRRPMSAEGRARVAAAQRKRWKAVHKAQRSGALAGTQT